MKRLGDRSGSSLKDLCGNILGFLLAPFLIILGFIVKIISAEENEGLQLRLKSEGWIIDPDKIHEPSLFINALSSAFLGKAMLYVEPYEKNMESFLHSNASKVEMGSTWKWSRPVPQGYHVVFTQEVARDVWLS